MTSQFSFYRIRSVALIAAMVLLIGAVPAAAAQPGDPFGDPFGKDEQSAIEIGVETDRDAVHPGGRLVIAVVITHNDGFHTNLNEPIVPTAMEGFTPIATEIQVASGPHEIGPIQWPKPHAVSVNFTGEPVDYLVYSDRAVAFVPVRIAGDVVPGEPLSFDLEITYQACDDVSCLPPETVSSSATVEVVESGDGTALPKSLDGFDASVFDAAWSNAGDDEIANRPDVIDDADSTDSTTPAATGTFFGIPLPGGGIGGLLILGFLGAAGGLILNLTPCVLPVIPIKVMTLSQHAGEDRLKGVMLGLWMALGVVVFWAALALPVLTLQGFTDPSRIFGIWWLTAGIGLVIAAMSLGLLGMFQISLPQGAYMINPKADSPWGSFIFGVMTAVLGLPCFGFVAGALVPAALTQGPAFVVVLFTSMGVGMAMPYLVLSIFPQLVEKLPRTGPASELVKHIMALLLLAAAAYFVGSGLIALVASKPYLAKLLHIWVAALFGVAAGLLLLVKTFQITKKLSYRGVFGFIAIAIAAFGLFVADRFTDDAKEEHEIRVAAMQQAVESGVLIKTIWNDYTPALMQRALDDGLVVIQDFTAEWCLNCKVLEKTVLGKNNVKALLQADDTVMIKVDLTGENPDGEAALEALGRTGIPTLAIFGPGLAEPWVASAYTPDQVVRAIERARGNAVSDAGG